MDRDLYADLGVRSTATAAELKAAWLRAARKHPDAGGDPERFLYAKLAYDFLADPGRRAKYDAARAAGPSRSDARETFDRAWSAWEATLGDLLPHLQAVRGAARGTDGWKLAGAAFDLVAHLRGKTKPKPPEPDGLALKLRRLKRAHADGLLTDAEYQAKRDALIESL